MARATLDADRLSSLFESQADALIAFFTRRTFDAHVALDLVGETFAVAFAKRRQFRGTTIEESVGWLYAIARTVLGRYVRRGVAERRALERLGVQRERLTEDEQQRAERLADLDGLRVLVGDALERIPTDQRSAVRLRVVDELEYPEVAERLQISEPAARARVSRGLRALHDLLSNEARVSDVRR